MKNLSIGSIERYRMHSDEVLLYFKSFGDDKNGAFNVPFAKHHLFVIASSELGWDHISVNLKNRCPTWEEMNYIKDMFFEPEEAAMQLHPPKHEYINTCKFCLHLWRPQNAIIPLPPSSMVGIKE